MANRAFSGFISVLTATVLGLLGITLYEHYIKPPYLSYTNLPLPINGAKPGELPSYMAGEIVPLIVARCNTDSVSHLYVISREMVPLDGSKPYLLKSELVPIEPGCHPAISNLHSSPAEATSREYFFRGYAELIGSSQTFHIPWQSVPFRIIAKERKAP